MFTRIIPPKLNPGDEIRVVAPSCSLKIISEENQKEANAKLSELGFKVTFGKHVNEMDDLNSSSILSRVLDLHEAFASEEVKGILTVIGGFNCNQLLRHLDWDLIAQNPKFFCGYSDTTALSNAIWAKTNIITYSGAPYSLFAQKLYFNYTLDSFKKCVMDDGAFTVEPSLEWSDDQWYIDQNKRNVVKNDGFWVLHEGEADGTIVGGNLCTLNLLHGTEYMPNLQETILFLEDDHESKAVNFDRDLQSLIHQPNFAYVRGICIGRFQRESGITRQLLQKIIDEKEELRDIPIIANLDFGHTDPKITFPIGGTAKLRVRNGEGGVKLEIIRH